MSQIIIVDKAHRKYMYFAPFLENTKVQPVAPILSTTHYATKKKKIALELLYTMPPVVEL